MSLALLGEWHCSTISKYDTGFRIVRKQRRDFPGGSVDKNTPATAGDMGMISGSGRFHLCATATKSAVWSPRAATTEPIHCNC